MYVMKVRVGVCGVGRKGSLFHPPNVKVSPIGYQLEQDAKASFICNNFSLRLWTQKCPSQLKPLLSLISDLIILPIQ